MSASHGEGAHASETGIPEEAMSECAPLAPIADAAMSEIGASAIDVSRIGRSPSVILLPRELTEGESTGRNSLEKSGLSLQYTSPIDGSRATGVSHGEETLTELSTFGGSSNGLFVAESQGEATEQHEGLLVGEALGTEAEHSESHAA